MFADYLTRFAHLHTNVNYTHWTAATCHRAPHKPLLLLAVMDLFAQGTITTNLIELTQDLAELFALYWARVNPPGRRGHLFLPFFHLKSDSFWHLVAQPGKEAILAATPQIQSMNHLREIALGARLDDDLYALLCVEATRNLLRTTLIETYFAPEVQAALVEQGTINTQAFRYSQELLEQARTKQAREAPAEEERYRPAARDQGFRRAIVTAYDHRCALCGIRMLTADGHTVVDAAHIVPWSINRDDHPTNGMALCRLCHWTFDEGLVSVSSRYAVLTSPQLALNHNVPGHLLTLAGRGIIGPAEQALWPALEALAWHRQHTFRRR